jgi:hypothetical protein
LRISVSDEPTFTVIARIPPDGIADFHAYEAAVLPLLLEHHGKLDRRLVNEDGTVEVHIVSFASSADFESYRTDARRLEHSGLLDRSNAKIELMSMRDFR